MRNYKLKYQETNPKGKLLILKFESKYISKDSILIIEINVENGTRFRALTKSYALYKTRLLKMKENAENAFSRSAGVTTKGVTGQNPALRPLKNSWPVDRGL